MPLKAELVEKTSSKGNKYVCVLIYITETYSKQVFLDSAELELLKATMNKKTN